MIDTVLDVLQKAFDRFPAEGDQPLKAFSLNASEGTSAMQSFQFLIEQPQIYRLGLTLLHFLWQGAVVAMVLALLCSVLRRRTAGYRYVASVVALIVMALLPVVTFCLVESPTAPPSASGSTRETSELHQESDDH